MADRGIALKAASGKTKSGRIVPSAGVSPDHAQIEMFEPKHVDGTTQLGVPREPNYHFSVDITDKAIAWTRATRSLTPDVPSSCITPLVVRIHLTRHRKSGSMSTRASSIKAETSCAKRFSHGRSRWG